MVLNTNGSWGQAITLGNGGQVNAVACAQSGKCVAGGLDFIVDENQGTWGKLRLVPVRG